MPATMILRFRDLAGPTISEHRKIIDTQGYVWWGWWNKAQERVPRHTFADFASEVIKNKPFHVYLVDSAKEALYRAALQEILPAPTEDPIASPEPVRTPDYYNTQTYKAWFKFTSIEDATGSADEQVRKWSYDEVAEFIDDPASSIFQDKRIFNVKEMLNRRHRTIYFAKPYSEANRDHLVELLPEEGPKNYTAQPVFRNSTYVVHVSDLHFSRQHHAFALKGDFVRKSLATLVFGYYGTPAKERPSIVAAFSRKEVIPHAGAERALGLKALEANAEALRHLGVRRLGLFGSAARGEAGSASDLDFVVEFEHKSFDAYTDLKVLLEDLFSCRVDLVLADSIKPRLRPIILNEATYASFL